ncbi:extracellular solute-binding protein [Vibrio owensii]|uniref:extracellular solute-binding protein n=1 Tax=Vibrio owensii TaxID=696485 RepID=UPI0040688A5A
MKLNFILSTVASLSLFSSVATAQILPEEGAELLVWANPGENAEVARYAAKKFEDKYNVGVEVKEVALMGSVDQMIQDAGSTRVGDVFEFPNNMVGAGVESGILMENLVSADRIKNEFIDSAVNSVTYSDGKIYGFPTSINSALMFYNKDLLPNGVESFEELIEKNQELNLTNVSNNEYAFLWNINDYYFSRMFLTMYGAYEFGNENTDPDDVGIVGDEAVKGLEAMLELKDLSVRNSNDATNAQVRQGLFSDGKVAALISGPWAYDTLKKSGVDIGISPIPTFKGKQLTTFSGFEAYGVSTFTKYPKAAQLFAAYITSEEFDSYRLSMANRLTPTKMFMEKVSADKSNEYVSALATQSVHTVPMPFILEMSFLWAPLSGAISDTWNKGVQPVDAMSKAGNSIELQIQMNK